MGSTISAQIPIALCIGPLLQGMLGLPSDRSSIGQAFILVFHDGLRALVTVGKELLGHRVSSDPRRGSVHSNRLLKKHFVQW